MKSSDRLILVAIPLIAVVIGVWVLLIAPKKNEAGELKDQAATLQAELDAAQAEVTVAETARQGFSANYSDLIKLGAAAPASDDQATLLNDLATLSTRNSVTFNAFTVSQTAAADAAAATPAPAPAAPEEAPPAESGGTTVAATAAPPTEVTAATLPIGAVVGPAGLSVMPYELTFDGTFFNATDFLADLDSAVEPRATGQPVVHGRLLTVNGFSLDLEQLDDLPNLEANFAVTSYLVPPEEGVEAGATPAGPAPIGSTTPPTTVTSAPTASLTP